MHPSKGLFNEILGMAGISGVNWLGDRGAALYSVIAVDVWKGVGVATVIYIAGNSVPFPRIIMKLLPWTEPQAGSSSGKLQFPCAVLP